MEIARHIGRSKVRMLPRMPMPNVVTDNIDYADEE